MLVQVQQGSPAAQLQLMQKMQLREQWAGASTWYDLSTVLGGAVARSGASRWEVVGGGG